MSLLVDHELYLRLVATMVLHERVPHRAISPPDRSPMLIERPARPSSSPVLIVEQSVKKPARTASSTTCMCGLCYDSVSRSLTVGGLELCNTAPGERAGYIPSSSPSRTIRGSPPTSPTESVTAMYVPSWYRRWDRNIPRRSSSPCAREAIPTRWVDGAAIWIQCLWQVSRETQTAFGLLHEHWYTSARTDGTMIPINYLGRRNICEGDYSRY